MNPQRRFVAQPGIVTTAVALAAMLLLQPRVATAQQTGSAGEFSFAVYGDSRPMEYLPTKAGRPDLVALFTEMYGFPLTIYLLSGWLQSRFPNVDWFSHDAGHLLEMMFGWKANPHFATG